MNKAKRSRRIVASYSGQVGRGGGLIFSIPLDYRLEVSESTIPKASISRCLGTTAWQSATGWKFQLYPFSAFRLIPFYVWCLFSLGILHLQKIKASAHPQIRAKETPVLLCRYAATSRFVNKSQATSWKTT